MTVSWLMLWVEGVMIDSSRREGWSRVPLALLSCLLTTLAACDLPSDVGSTAGEGAPIDAEGDVATAEASMPLVLLRPAEGASTEVDLCAELGYKPTPDLGGMEKPILPSQAPTTFTLGYRGSPTVGPSYFTEHEAVLLVSTPDADSTDDLYVSATVPDAFISASPVKSSLSYSPRINLAVPLHLGENRIGIALSTYELEISVALEQGVPARIEYAARPNASYEFSRNAEAVLSNALERAFTALHARGSGDSVSKIELQLPIDIVADHSGDPCENEPDPEFRPLQLINVNIGLSSDLIEFVVSSGVPASLRIDDVSIPIGRTPTQVVYRERSQRELREMMVLQSADKAPPPEPLHRIVDGVRIVADGYFEYIGEFEGIRRSPDTTPDPAALPITNVDLFPMRTQ